MQLKRKIDGIIEVEEVLDIIEVGATIPVRCRLANGMNVVVKYMKNPFGQRVLINELIGSCISDMIGLNIPEYGICNLSKDVIINTNLNEDIDERNAGIAFYTKDYSSTVPPVRSMLTFVEEKQTEKIILFDHIVNNIDRHMGNLLLDLHQNAILYIIDNSHIVTEKNEIMIEQELQESSIYSKRVLEKNKEVYDNLCFGMGYNEGKVILEAQKIRKILTNDVLRNIANEIPEIWAESVGRSNVDKLFEIISKRIEVIDDLGEMIVEERRKQ